MAKVFQTSDKAKSMQLLSQAPWPMALGGWNGRLSLWSHDRPAPSSFPPQHRTDQLRLLQRSNRIRNHQPSQKKIF
jgi:hypothetical protein